MTDQQPEVSRENLDRFIAKGWDELQSYIAGLSDVQFSGPTDASGWTVQDHLLHLADWEIGVAALLQGESRLDAMGLTPEQWAMDGYDEKNEIMRQNARAKRYDRAGTLARLEVAHTLMLNEIAKLSDDDLKSPVSRWSPGSTHQDWIAWTIVGNTFGHYEEHIPWMKAISDKAV